MNKPKRGRASIKKPTNKKFNTLRKMIQKVKGNKKKNQAKEQSTKETGIQRYLNSIIQVLLIFIYCEESKTGRKGDREAAVRRERGQREISVKLQNRRWGKGKERNMKP